MVVAKLEKIPKTLNYLHYPIDKQRSFNRMLAEHVGFDFKRGVIKESAHPFTTDFHNRDVRITTHYYEDNLGRSREFWTPLFDQLKETYPENLADVDLDTFILSINKAAPSLIRTEADELTYCLHIMIRYEIEKMIFENKVTIDELPELWNQKYEEYLGVRPETYAEGILQDIHWATGSFGYFPSYALGTAIAAQIQAHLEQVMPLKQYLEDGNFEPINAYLKEHVHQFGKTKSTNEILENMMDEKFNPQYYIDYLKEKFTGLYANL